MKKRSVLLFIVLIIIIAGIFYTCKEYNRTNISLANTNAIEVVEAGDLLNSFIKDDSAANKKYLGKVVAVKGTIKNIDSANGYTIILGEAASMSSVRCAMDSLFNIYHQPISVSDNIILKGICTGFNEDELLGSDIILNRCVISTEK